jgi:hypothetical protein
VGFGVGWAGLGGGYIIYLKDLKTDWRGEGEGWWDGKINKN